MSEVIKKKRVSKKNKISWRKYSNIDDVTEFLEEQRQDERIGNIVDKSNDELFIIDTKKTVKNKSKLTERQRRKQVAKRPPRCFASLENTSNVQDPIIKRNRVRTKEERKHFIAKSIDIAKRAQGIIPKRELQSIDDQVKARKKSIEIKKKKKQPKYISTDIWEEGEVKSKFDSQWIDKTLKEYHLVNTDASKMNIPKTLKQVSSQLNSVTVPHPGTSYNPSLKDHQDLLKLVEDDEVKIIQNENHLDRVTTSMFNKMTSDQKEDDDLKQLAQLEEEEEDSAENSSSDELPYKSVNPPTVVKPKTKSARKLREQNQIKNALQDIKLDKKKITDIHRIKHLTCDIEKMNAELLVMKTAKKINRALKKEGPRRISKQKFKDIDADIAMPEDIAGNLRNVKVEGSILSDRFKSLQQRNILPPTVDLGLRKRREIKRFTRKSHQEELPQPQRKKARK